MGSAQHWRSSSGPASSASGKQWGFPLPLGAPKSHPHSPSKPLPPSTYGGHSSTPGCPRTRRLEGALSTVSRSLPPLSGSRSKGGATSPSPAAPTSPRPSKAVTGAGPLLALLRLPVPGPFPPRPPDSVPHSPHRFLGSPQGPGQASGLRPRAPPPPDGPGSLPAVPAPRQRPSPAPHPTGRGWGLCHGAEAAATRLPGSFIVDSKLPRWRPLLPPRNPPPARPPALPSPARPGPARPSPAPGPPGPPERRPLGPPRRAPPRRTRQPARPAPRLRPAYLRRSPLSWRRRSRRPGRANSAAAPPPSLARSLPPSLFPCLPAWRQPRLLLPSRWRELGPGPGPGPPPAPPPPPPPPPHRPGPESSLRRNRGTGAPHLGGAGGRAGGSDCKSRGSGTETGRLPGGHGGLGTPR
ncbi:basic salivary proline-rich protein 2-like [Dromiciops gliroides]|uniref:basic salivary proline-rich protein 2-like n=1 Tax=Dromiciops gliroides TaxID=33562 RepID=UPI001CC7093C|nr:basic salivary proline-rich protein 2-like [Dromiciops gliroides]